MARLSELKALLAKEPKPKSAVAAVDGRAVKSLRSPSTRAASAPVRETDVDIAKAFADVKPLPAPNRARRSVPRPSTTPAQRLADEADALTASKFGSERIDAQWEIGQEQEAHQTFLRRGSAATC
jgi:hypothetical protein